MQYGRYETERELGRGSMGIVYQAHDPHLDRRVALKILRPDLVTTETFVQRFLKEAKAAARLSHPNIVAVYDADEAQGTIYIAMELLAGEPLDRIMRTRKFSESEIIHFGIQVARVLDYAHENGIVHRDIKPANIILDPKGQIKITDFGVARIEDPSAPQLTMAGEVMGTPAYMSPEQALGKSVDGRTDLYSLGVVLYELSTGVRPFRGETLSAVLMAIVHETPPEPQSINASLSPDLARIIMRCMSKVPEERFQTGEALAKALESMGRGGESSATVVPPAKKSPLRLGLFFLIVSLVLGIGAGLAYHFLSKTGETRVEPAPGAAVAPSPQQTKLSEGAKSESVSGLDEGKRKIDELERTIAAARIKQEETDKRIRELEQAKLKADELEKTIAAARIKQDKADKRAKELEEAKLKADELEKTIAAARAKQEAADKKIKELEQAKLKAEAQQPVKVPRIGYISQYSGAAGPPSGSIKAFLEGLGELGYVEGKNIAIEYRFTEGKNERLPELAAELARQKVNIIVTETGWAAQQAKKVTQTIPIVMEGSADAVSQGLVASLAHPGGNVTGLTALHPATSGKRLQLLAEVVPKLTHVGVLWAGGSSPVADREWEETRAAAQPLNVQLYSVEARSAAELPAAFAKAVRQRVQAILLFNVPSLETSAAAAQVAAVAVQNRLPTMGLSSLFPRQGCLMSYGLRSLELSRRAATYVDRILKGANPADLPVEQPAKSVLVVNLKTAKALGLTIPQSLLSRADEVIQ